MRKHIRRFTGCHLAIILPLIIGSESTTSCGSADPVGSPFPYQLVGNIDRVHFKEPSGIVFHPKRGTLFVVGDEGDIEEIKRDGTLVKQRRIRQADFEGITCNPSTGLLYAAVEGEEKIDEIDPEDFGVLREFAIGRTFQGEVVLRAGGQGIEAIAFVPDTTHPEGGTFYVGNQSFDLKSTEDPSAIFEVDVPLKSNAARESTARIIRVFRLEIIDISDMYYDRVSDHFYVISDALNGFFSITRTGVVLGAYSFPGVHQEGLAIDEEGFVYIAQDSGGIFKLRWNREK